MLYSFTNNEVAVSGSVDPRHCPSQKTEESGPLELEMSTDPSAVEAVALPSEDDGTSPVLAEYAGSPNASDENPYSGGDLKVSANPPEGSDG